MKQPDLFGGQTEIDVRKKRGWNEVKKIRNYRKSEYKEKKCGNCDHLVIKNFSKKYFKCELISLKASASSDVRVGHVCDLFKITLIDK